MDSLLLRSFLTVYELGSVGRAAQQIGVSQPALSKTIRRLEDRLQAALFERTPTGMVPTVVGETLARHARLIEAELRHAENEVASLRGGMAGHINLGTSPAVAAALMAIVSTDLWQARPGLRVTVTEDLPEALIDATREGKLDCAVCTETPLHGDPELVTVPLYRDRLAAFAGAHHPLVAKGRQVSMKALMDYPWALSPYTGVVRQWFDSRFTAAGLTPPLPQVNTTCIPHFKGLLLGNHFMAFMPLSAVEEEVAAGTIVHVRRPDFELVRTVAAVHRSRGRVSAAALAVIETIRQAALRHGALPLAGPA